MFRSFSSGESFPPSCQFSTWLVFSRNAYCTGAIPLVSILLPGANSEYTVPAHVQLFPPVSITLLLQNDALRPYEISLCLFEIQNLFNHIISYKPSQLTEKSCKCCTISSIQSPFFHARRQRGVTDRFFEEPEPGTITPIRGSECIQQIPSNTPVLVNLSVFHPALC